MGISNIVETIGVSNNNTVAGSSNNLKNSELFDLSILSRNTCSTPQAQSRESSAHLSMHQYPKSQNYQARNTQNHEIDPSQASLPEQQIEVRLKEENDALNIDGILPNKSDSVAEMMINALEDGQDGELDSIINFSNNATLSTPDNLDNDNEVSCDLNISDSINHQSSIKNTKDSTSNNKGFASSRLMHLKSEYNTIDKITDNMSDSSSYHVDLYNDTNLSAMNEVDLEADQLLDDSSDQDLSPDGMIACTQIINPIDTQQVKNWDDIDRFLVDYSEHISDPRIDLSETIEDIEVETPFDNALPEEVVQGNQINQYTRSEIETGRYKSSKQNIKDIDQVDYIGNAQDINSKNPKLSNNNDLNLKLSDQMSDLEDQTQNNSTQDFLDPNDQTPETAKNFSTNINIKDLASSNIKFASAPVSQERPVELHNQISISIEKALNEGVRKIQVSLHPESLGKLNIELNLDNDIITGIKFIAQKHETLESIKADRILLEQVIKDITKGGDASLSFSLGSYGQENNQPGNSYINKSTMYNNDTYQAVVSVDAEIQESIITENRVNLTI